MLPAARGAGASAPARAGRGVHVQRRANDGGADLAAVIFDRDDDPEHLD